MSTLPPPKSYNSSWQLISQGAEARVWLVPNFVSSNADCGSLTATVVCKERFPKSYRHPALDESLTRSRTKAEAKNLSKCRRAGVAVPIVLGIDIRKKIISEKEDFGHSACIFLEYIQGCALRSFLNIPCNQNNEHEKTENKRPNTCRDPSEQKVNYSTRVDEFARKVAHATGCAIGRMHNACIIHGDLTTSNILLRNPPQNQMTVAEWSADIVLIDFGLSTTSNSTKNTSGHEERAVDLYVLERAFATTHIGSEILVQEVLRGYKAVCHTSDSVFQRLSQVRLRGRKRECFG